MRVEAELAVHPSRRLLPSPRPNLVWQRDGEESARPAQQEREAQQEQAERAELEVLRETTVSKLLLRLLLYP